MLIPAILFVFILAPPLGLYLLRTREKRRLLRGIRASAGEHGWQFHPRRSIGEPADFRMSGYTVSGLRWVLYSEGAKDLTGGWGVRLELTLPDLAAAADVAVLPRDGSGRPAAIASRQAEMREFPTGVPGFDSMYEVIAIPWQLSVPPLNPALAERFLNWPKDTVVPHAVRAWRDASGCHLEARLPGMPSRETIRHFLVLGEDFSARLPAPAFSAQTNSATHRTIP